MTAETRYSLRELHVFHHPYPDAGWRGVETGAPSPGTEPIGLLAA